MLELALYPLVCIGSHRIWNEETITAYPRGWLSSIPYTTPLTCRDCNAFWIALFWAILLPWITVPVLYQVYLALAAYPLIRVTQWAVDRHDFDRKSVEEMLSRDRAVEAAAKKEKCSQCEAAKKEREKYEFYRSHAQRTVIISYEGNNLAALDNLAADKNRYVELWIGSTPDMATIVEYANKFNNVHVKPLLVPELTPEIIIKNLIILGNASIILNRESFRTEEAKKILGIIDTPEVQNLQAFTWETIH